MEVDTVNSWHIALDSSQERIYRKVFVGEEVLLIERSERVVKGKPIVAILELLQTPINEIALLWVLLVHLEELSILLLTSK